MRKCRDTFLHFLADNLGTIPVHNLRMDANTPESAYVQMNSVNVEFLNSAFGAPGHESAQSVSIDVVNDNELTALDWAATVANLLQQAGYTPKLDYSIDPANPVPVGTNIGWDAMQIKFRPITTDGGYYRYVCLLSLKHRIS